jgi:hypothetical protein
MRWVDVDEHEVGIGAATDDPRAELHEVLRQHPRVLNGALLIRLELLAGSQLEGHGFRGDDVHQRSPWTPGNTVLSTALVNAARQKTSPPRGPRNVLWVGVVTRSAWGNGLGWFALHQML